MKHTYKPRAIPVTQKLKLAFIMDPMEKLLLKFDTSITIMMEAQNRGHQIYYIEPREIVYQSNSLYANAREVIASNQFGFRVISEERLDLKTCDIVFNRKEPPFDVGYLYLTQLLEILEPDVFVINSPAGVRKANEKLYILEFLEWIPDTFVSKNVEEIEFFFKKQKTDLIVKPLDQKGGEGIMLLPRKTKNPREILSRMTFCGTKWVMAQRFLKKNLTEGDKRILLLNGEILGQYRKIPKKGEFRANLSLGAKYVKTDITNDEQKLVEALKSKLIEDGLYFVGIDVIDGKLIEINVTSPAGIPEINELDKKRPEVQIVNFLETQSVVPARSSVLQVEKRSNR